MTGTILRAVSVCLMVVANGMVKAPAANLERWVYCPTNLLVDVERVESLMREAKGCGYTHFMIADSKFARLFEMDKRYFDNVRRLQKTAAELGITVAPCVFPVGYSNDILSHDPNLAEALPVKDALFIVKDRKAQVLGEPLIYLPTIAERDQWAFIDETFALDGEALVASELNGENARLMKPVRVAKFRQYHASVRVKTDSFEGTPEIKVLTNEGKSLCYTSLQVASTQDWQVHHVTFNSLDHDQLQLYFGVWDAGHGKIWVADPSLEECGAVNLLRRDETPLNVFIEQNGVKTEQLTEGVDFLPFVDPQLGMVPYAGEYESWHEPPTLELLRPLPNGTRLRVSYYHPHVIYDGQVVGCVTNRKFNALLKEQAEDMVKLWPTKDWMMSHDEWRMMGWDTAFAGLGLTPGTIMGRHAEQCRLWLRERVNDNKFGKLRVMVWSDMFDPHHNAVDNYYLVNGSIRQSWQFLDKSITIVNWNFDKRVASLRFFADRGHPQLIAGYYDESPMQIQSWLDTVREYDIPNVTGVMYTTWRGNYRDLKAFAEVVDRYEAQR